MDPPFFTRQAKNPFYKIMQTSTFANFLSLPFDLPIIKSIHALNSAAGASAGWGQEADAGWGEAKTDNEPPATTTNESHIFTAANIEEDVAATAVDPFANDNVMAAGGEAVILGKDGDEGHVETDWGNEGSGNAEGDWVDSSDVEAAVSQW